jgi:RNA polymerase sigma factor (sigma-70 family)
MKMPDFTKYRKKIQAIIATYSSLRHKYTRDDLEQEVYAVLVESYLQGHLQNDKNISAWVATVAENRLRDIIEYDRAVKRDSRRVELLSSHELSPQAGPHARAEQKELIARIREKMESLTREQQLAIKLRVFDGMSLREIVAEHGGNEDLWRTRAARGLRDLRYKLGGQDPGIKKNGTRVLPQSSRRKPR